MHLSARLNEHVPGTHSSLRLAAAAYIRRLRIDAAHQSDATDGTVVLAIADLSGAIPGTSTVTRETLVSAWPRDTGERKRLALRNLYDYPVNRGDWIPIEENDNALLYSESTSDLGWMIQQLEQQGLLETNGGLRFPGQIRLTMRGRMEVENMHHEHRDPGSAHVLQRDPRDVFVVHGRNMEAQRAMFAFLRALGLHPLEWEELIARTGKGAPHNLEAVIAGLPVVQAVIVLLTGDDEARTRPQFRQEKQGVKGKCKPQPRQNVLIEAGMALALAPARTILVEIGELRNITDVEGLNSVRIRKGNDVERTNLRGRLVSAGCNVQDHGTDWLREGDFQAAINAAQPSAR